MFHRILESQCKSTIWKIATILLNVDNFCRVFFSFMFPPPSPPPPPQYIYKLRNYSFTTIVIRFLELKSTIKIIIKNNQANTNSERNFKTMLLLLLLQFDYLKRNVVNRISYSQVAHKKNIIHDSLWELHLPHFNGLLL